MVNTRAHNRDMEAQQSNNQPQNGRQQDPDEAQNAASETRERRRSSSSRSGSSTSRSSSSSSAEPATDHSDHSVHTERTNHSSRDGNQSRKSHRHERRISNRQGRKGKLSLDKYAGTTSKIRADVWINLYQRATEEYSDRERVRELMNSLTDDALCWYGTEVATNSRIKWNEARELFLNHFGQGVSNPLVEATRRRLKISETVKSYFDDKLRLLRSARVPEEHMSGMLTDGMPNSYQEALLSDRLRRPHEWLLIAQQLESRRKIHTFPDRKDKSSSHQKQPLNAGNRGAGGFATVPANDRQRGRGARRGNRGRNQDNPGRPPQCQFCAMFNEAAYHWHRDCPRRRPPNPNPDDEVPRNPEEAQVADCLDLSAPTSSRLLHVAIKVNGSKLNAMLDSGSTINMLSENVAKQLKLFFNVSDTLPVRQCEGYARTRGSALALISIGTLTKNLKLHVVKDLPYACIIGLYAARDLKLKLDFEALAVSQKSVQLPIRCMTANVVNIDSLIADRLVFAKDDKDVGKITVAKHHIRLLPDVSPIALPPYRYFWHRQQELYAHVQGLLERNLIRPSRSPWALPILLVPKKDGKSRPCQDLRLLNKNTVPEREPLPVIQDIIDKLAKSRYFTTLDLAWGYWQVKLDEESIEKTAFVTPFGQYEWLVMPFGLKNAPSTFQKIIRIVLGHLLLQGVESYLDDILVHTETLEQHVDLLRRVLDQLESHGVRLRREKCTFAAKEVDYLGYVVCSGTVRPSPTKLKAVSDYPRPGTVRQVQQFLGLANYYRNYVPNFSKIAAPITALTKKDKPFNWTEDCEEAFSELKTALTNDPVLKIYRHDRQCEVHTDACSVGLAGILMQKDEDGNKHVIAYWSRRLTETEEKYAATELECLAVVESIEHYRLYFEGAHFDVYTDCRALEWLFGLKDPKSRLFRWTVRLSTYNYTMHYRPGIRNQAADALSRNPVALMAFDIDEIKERQHEINKEEIRNLVDIDGVAHVRYRGLTRKIVPASLIISVLQEAHDKRNHPNVRLTQRLVAMRYWWPQMAQDVTRYVQSCHACQLNKVPTRR